MARRLTPEQFARRLREITEEAKDNIRGAVQESALRVERDAKLLAPVDTGTLRNSISHQLVERNDLTSAIVGTNVFYGKFQEYGTGQRGRASGTITPADYEYGSSLGIPASPFLTPALLRNREVIRRLISRAIQNAIRG